MRDPRTPRHAKLLAGLTVGLAVSPIDPIPDFIPVLGYADDVVLVPTGAYLSRRAIPDDVLDDCRRRVADDPDAGLAGWVVAAIIVLAWLIVSLWVAERAGLW